MTSAKSQFIRSLKPSSLSWVASPTLLHTFVYGLYHLLMVSLPEFSWRRLSEEVLWEPTRSSLSSDNTSSSQSQWELSWEWTQWNASFMPCVCSGYSSIANSSRLTAESSLLWISLPQSRNLLPCSENKSDDNFSKLNTYEPRYKLWKKSVRFR